MMKRATVIAHIIILMLWGIGYAQQAGDCVAVPGGPPCPPITLSAPQAGTQLTPSQAEVLQKLTPEQRKVIEEVKREKGGVLTPDAVEALRTRPEFQNLTAQDILQGKEMLEKKGSEKIAPGKKTPIATSKPVTISEKDERSVFERVRAVGKYQDISTSLKPFGYEFFQESALKVVTDRKDIPVPADYVIGPGDEVKILLWGRINANYSLTVDRNGNITVPQVGPISVAGLTFEQMGKHLIKQSEQFVGANIDVTMGSLKSIPIFVLGDAKRPGAYTIGSFATITDALLIAGGPAGIGTMRNIQLRRKDKVITTLDLYDLLLKGDKSKDTILQAGDVVFVPVAGPIVGVAGNVRRPAIYELKGAYDLETLLNLAGGIIPTAYTQQIQVERIIKNERQAVVDIDDKHLTKAKDFHLQDVDLVKIFNIVERETNVVFVNGNIKRPGKYEYKKGMRIRDLIKDRKDLLEETVLDYALLVRLEPPNFERRLVPFDLEKALLSEDPARNFELQPRDTVYIFSKWFFKDKPYVTVEGEVRNAQSRPIQGAQDKDDLGQTRRAREDRMWRGMPARDDAKQEIPTGDDLEPTPRIREDLAGHSTSATDDFRQDALMKEDVDLAQKSAGEDSTGRPMRVRVDLSQNMKVRDAIMMAGDVTKTAYLQKGEILRVDKNREYITIYFHVGKAIDGDPENNLLLREEDRIIIHSLLEYEYKKTVSVGGDVLKPGKYQYVQGMTVKDLVFAAGNALESAYLDEAEITSQSVEGDKIVMLSHRNINLRKALRGDPSDNLALKPYDRLSVKKLQDWNRERFVTVSGEVRYPGRYISKKNERLSSIIERAGGYSDDAYLRAAVYTRTSVRELQQKSLDEMISRMERTLLAQSSSVTATSPESIQARQVELQQRQKFIEVLKKLQPTGRMTVYLAHLRLLKGSQYDVEVQDGDVLYIPTKNSVVNVAGAVMTNATFVYSDGMGYEGYVQMAGGYSEYADTGNVFVIKADGSARKMSSGFANWNPFKKRWEMAGFEEIRYEIEPGDSIVVPEKLERTAWLRELKDITQIVANIGISAATIAMLYKTLN